MSEVDDALRAQAAACRRLGSLQYALLLESALDDPERRVQRVLDGRSTRPTHDALPLRLLSGLHRAALSGEAPELAERFPSCGGDGRRIDLNVVLEVMDRLGDEIDSALARPVQTNEVGRSICLMMLAHWLPSIGIEEFDLWEIGSSAGLNLSFDHYSFRLDDVKLGNPGSRLLFTPGSSSFPFDIGPRAECVERKGCDMHPIDLSTESIHLESFVWPDQSERRQRLLAAIEITRPLHHEVERASADEWLMRRFEEPNPRPIVVFHSIVWQYLEPRVQDRLRTSLRVAGENGVDVVWARMEPAGSTADLRADVCQGGVSRKYHLADVGYHGEPFLWVGQRLQDPRPLNG